MLKFCEPSLVLLMLLATICMSHAGFLCLNIEEGDIFPCELNRQVVEKNYVGIRDRAWTCGDVGPWRHRYGPRTGFMVPPRRMQYFMFNRMNYISLYQFI